MTLRFDYQAPKEFMQRMINCLNEIDGELYKSDVSNLEFILTVLEEGVAAKVEDLATIGKMTFEFDFDLGELTDTARDMLMNTYSLLI